MKKLKNLKIDTDKIKYFNPCEPRFDNWLEHYKDFKGDIIDFLNLDNITPEDKIWVCIRVLPKDLLEVFAIDCAFAAAYADAAYAVAAANAAYASYAAAASAAYANADAFAAAYANADAFAAAYADAASYAAYYAAANTAHAAYASYAAERERQIDALIYLVENYEK